MDLLRPLAVIAVTLVALWLALVVTLAVIRPRDLDLRAALRLVPALIRLVRRLATDRDLPGSTRVVLWLLLGYLALPIDLIPDFVPVLGYVDDVVVVALALRRVIRTSGLAALERHWPGSPESLGAIRRLAGII